MSGLLGMCSAGKNFSFWAEFGFGGQHYDEILITLVGLGFSENFNVNVARTVSEACRTTWILGTSSAFALGARKTN